MGPDDKTNFALAVGALIKTFGQEVSDPLLHGYWLGLSDMTIEQVQTAVVSAIQNSQALPKPVELRKLVGVHVDKDDRAIAAWADVLKATGLGSYKHIDFADRLINATIRNLGGWPNFLARLTDAEAEKWARLEFLRTYSAFASSGVSGELLAPLPGLSQAVCVGGVIGLPIPVVVGCDPQRKTLPCMVRKSDVQMLEFRKA